MSKFCRRWRKVLLHEKKKKKADRTAQRQFQAVFPVITGSFSTNVIAHLHGFGMHLTAGRTVGPTVDWFDSWLNCWIDSQIVQTLVLQSIQLLIQLWKSLANQWPERRLVTLVGGCRAIRRSVRNAGTSNGGRSLCVQISRERSYPLPIISLQRSLTIIIRPTL